MSGKKSAEAPANEAFRVSAAFKAAFLIPCLGGGMLYAAALPPFNWSFAAFIVLIPLFYAGLYFRWKFRFLCGWIWGLGWAFFAYRFLREIHPAIPYLMAPVMALWPAVFTLVIGFYASGLFSGKLLNRPWSPELPPLRSTLYVLSAAALFTVLEWSRCRLFVWNDLSVTMWRHPVFMQTARIAGRYGVSFFITSVNGLIFSLIFFRRRLYPAAVMALCPLIACAYGVYRVKNPVSDGALTVWRCALIQGNLPQQRSASAEGIWNAVAVYTGLSKRMLEYDPDTIIWPECAVPIPLRAASVASEFYRRSLSGINCQMMIGTLDFDRDGGMTNSALLRSPEGRFTGKYDKFHRVPFGEYVPFRRFLPEAVIRKFDMGRDLSAGTSVEPLTVREDVRSGTVVCYEGVFSYLAAGFARHGANVLTAVSNDVWYPESSEPEQHLANAVMRCVETGLPMVRCGNNGGSGVVDSRGRFTRYIGTPSARPELLREKAAGIVEVTLQKDPELTLAVKYENLAAHLLLCGLILELLWLPLAGKHR